MNITSGGIKWVSADWTNATHYYHLVENLVFPVEAYTRLHLHDLVLPVVLNLD